MKNKRILTAVITLLVVASSTKLALSFDNAYKQSTVMNPTSTVININDFTPAKYNEDTFLVFYSLLSDKSDYVNKGLFLVKQVDKNSKVLKEYTVKLDKLTENANETLPTVYQNYMDKNNIYISNDKQNSRKYLIKYDFTKEKFTQFEDEQINSINFFGNDNFAKIKEDKTSYIYNFDTKTKLAMDKEEVYTPVINMCRFNNNYIVSTFGKNYLQVIDDKGTNRSVAIANPNKETSLGDVPTPVKIENDKLIFKYGVNKCDFYTMDKNFKVEHLFDGDLGTTNDFLNINLIGPDGQMFFPYNNVKDSNFSQHLKIGVANFDKKTVVPFDEPYIKAGVSYLPLYFDYNKYYFYIAATTQIDNKVYDNSSYTKDKYKSFSKDILIVDATTYNLVNTIHLDNDGAIYTGETIICVPSAKS